MIVRPPNKQDAGLEIRQDAFLANNRRGAGQAELRAPLSAAGRT
jgi:hypothetical protein